MGFIRDQLDATAPTESAESTPNDGPRDAFTNEFDFDGFKLDTSDLVTAITVTSALKNLLDR